MQTGMFAKHYRRNRDGTFELDEDGKKILDLHLTDIPKSVKNKVSNRLNEKRVVQHIPADQSDFNLEETTWRYLCDYEGQALLLQNVSRENLKEDAESASLRWKDVALKESAKKKLEEILSNEAICTCLHHNHINISRIRRGLIKIALEPHRSLVGLKEGKLKALKAVRITSHNTNYGISLGTPPRLLPFHKVSEQLKEIRSANHGKLPKIIRKGSLIYVNKGTWAGFWKVTSVKDSQAYGVSIDISQPHLLCKAKGNAKIPIMLKDGLVVYDPPLTGIDASSFD